MSSNMVNTRRGLAGWDWEIDLSEWFDPAVPFPDAVFGIAEALRNSGWNYRDDPSHPSTGMSLTGICHQMEMASNAYHFDALLRQVYDMADRDHVHIITGPDCQTRVVV